MKNIIINFWDGRKPLKVWKVSEKELKNICHNLRYLGIKEIQYI